ncbi:MAG TPA: DUF4097 family beta strand repeat-containing protein [Pyrinomonadaceae bacterium]|nr:DUF4097 family beta strand repeat-containing protein [Pyrinomonadaceae bacterium]
MKTLIATAILLLALASTGIGPASATGLFGQGIRPVPSVPATENSTADPVQRGEELREEFHQSYPLAPTGRVSLANINGGVQIKVWDRASVQVDAIKKAYRRERLNEARIEVTSTEDNLRIKTEYPEQNQTFRGDERRYDNPATVEYSLTVPRKAVLESVELVNGSLDIDGVEGNVKASSINGKVNARGLQGEAKLSTINGPLIANFTHLDESKAISLTSVNGNLTLVIPSDSNASVRAGTVHGSINNDFGLQVRHGEYVGHNLEGQIGAGGPRIKLDNVNGAININHADDGRTISPATSVVIDRQKIREEAQRSAEDDAERRVEQAAAIAESTRANAQSMRLTRQAQRDAQRQVDQALQEAQREIERAQRELQRQQRMQVRVVNRVKAVSAVGVGETYYKVNAQETKSFQVSGAPRVNIRTFDGHVTVRGWDKAEVSYKATKLAPDDESLKQINVVSEQQGQVISVNATNPNQYNGSVNIEVFVPKQSGLHVSSGDGAVSLDGVSGEITLRSGDGAIEVSNSGGQLQVNTGDGTIQISKFDGQVDARTGDGPIALDGNFNALSARTGDGEISLTVPAGSSFTIETNSPEEITNQGFAVAEDITPSPRLKRWRIGNGGKVFVLRTGEGKILLRPAK